MTTIATPNLGVPTYNYKFHDAGNNEIKSDDPSLPTFVITTTRGLMDLAKHTTVVCVTRGDKPSRVRGEIDWSTKRIKVAGESRLLSQAKHKIGGTLSPNIEWTWTSGRYTTTRRSRVWTAKRGQEVLAIYTSLKVNAFSKNELATIRFLRNVPNEEKVFLILALMYHDLQMPPVAEPKSLKQVAGEAAVGVVTNVASTVISNAGSCVVQ